MKTIQTLTLIGCLFVALASCQKAAPESSTTYNYPASPAWYQNYDQVFDYIWDFGLDVAVVKKDGHYGYVDKSGNEILPPVYDRIPWSIHPFPGGRPQTCVKDSLVGIMSPDHKIILECRYDEIEFFKYWDGYKVKSSELWGLVDKDGKVLTPCKYSQIDWFCEGLAAFQDPETELWGYLDDRGREVIRAQYTSAGRFYNGSASVELPCVSYDIDSRGRKVAREEDYAYEVE